MLYTSTRGQAEKVTSANAIKKGLAGDGGLFVPENIPVMSRDEIKAFTSMSYRDRALEVLRKYLTDYTEDELTECVEDAYNSEKFDSPKIVPLKKISESVNVLELWHGPTSAFKDIALQILPHFLSVAVNKTGDSNDVLILVATSGDTGKAALEGFRDVDGINIFVFYPIDGVSEIQKLQMTTQEGDNVFVSGVEGNFDDTQNGVKAIFKNEELAKDLQRMRVKLSSANSINWGRLLPQIVYYFSGYADMITDGTIVTGEEINVVVPTGNFGNILAGYYAKRMGLPVRKFICASNENNILSDFIRTGVYSLDRKFSATNSPSMDILISSNLERLLYMMSGNDPDSIKKWMEQLASDGKYEVDKKTFEEISKIFYGNWASQEETLREIADLYEKYGYLVDTHTAVAFSVYGKYAAETGDNATKTMIMSTANPFKFAGSIYKALFPDEGASGMSEFKMADKISKYTGEELPKALKCLKNKKARFTNCCQKEEMERAVREMIFL